MLQRAQVLLGTVVGIRIDAPGAVGEAAMARAFARIAQVHAAMSFHEAGSDLRRLARGRPGDCIAVAPDTHAVLRLALELELQSQGAFNACCAATLVARGLLPAPPDAPTAAATSLTEGIELLDDGQVRLRQGVWIDLGGIAKGYAVDQAVEALRAEGAQGGVVNAGGDLRVFGSTAVPVRLRDPCNPTALRLVAEITELACATSAGSLSPGRTGTGHLVGRSENPPLSVTVFAPQCAVADALTKVVWLQGEAALATLRARGAQALIWRTNGLLELT